MGVTGDLLDLLDELLAAENAAPVQIDAPCPRVMLGCGVHEPWRDDEAHLAECWGWRCPSCGDEVLNTFLYHLNHEAAEHGTCGSIELRLNHLTYDIRHGRKPDSRDLTVLDLGYRLGPDGAQQWPDGSWNVMLPRRERDEHFERWGG